MVFCTTFGAVRDGGGAEEERSFITLRLGMAAVALVGVEVEEVGVEAFS